MQFTDSVFKAYDIRGVVGTEVTEGLALAVGRALADLLTQEGAVAVGHDMRPDSELLARRVREGLVRQGRVVWDIGLVTSDMIYFATGHYKLAGGAMITASHNPGKYNGMKLCRQLAEPIGQDTGLLDIKAAILHDSFEDCDEPGTMEQHDITEAWITHALSFVQADRWPAYKVAVDAGNGMAGAIIPKLEPHVPLKVTEMYFELDGTFPNHPANPLEPANVQDEIERIKRDQLDFGIAFDGDGDRAFLIDEKGEELSASVLGAILATAILEKHPGATILYNVACSQILPEVITTHGGKAVRCRVGHSFIKAQMRQLDAPFAAEHSGHFYFKDDDGVYADSGLVAALVAVDVLAKSGKTLSQLVAPYRKYADSGEINVEVVDPAAQLEALAKHYHGGHQDRLDGLSVYYNDWWFSARPSNTEPVLRLNVEAHTPEALAPHVEELRRLTKE